VVGWGQTNSIPGGEATGRGVPPNFEFRGSYVLANIYFTQPPTKTVSEHVTGNHEYSIYNNLRQQRILGSPTLIFFG
jgi:hypothetical protein